MAGLTALAITANAEPGKFRDHKGPPHERAGKHLHALRQLNLSDQQREQIRSLMQSAHEQNRPRMEALAAERGKLRELMHANPVNPGAIRAQTMRIAELESELHIARAQQRAAIESVLTPQQREQWKQLRAKREEEREKFHREQMRERRQPRAPVS